MFFTLIKAPVNRIIVVRQYPYKYMITALKTSVFMDINWIAKPTIRGGKFNRATDWYQRVTPILHHQQR
jgi:hypothetical protein